MHLNERHNFAPQPPSKFLFILQNCTPPRAAATSKDKAIHDGVKLVGGFCGYANYLPNERDRSGQTTSQPCCHSDAGGAIGACLCEISEPA